MSAEQGAGAGLERLASALVGTGALPEAWQAAFRAAPRHLFVPDTIWAGQGVGADHARATSRTTDPDAWQAAVWSDVPLTTQWDDGNHTGPEPGRTPTSSSSMPTMVLSMLDDLDVHPGHRVLEIGTGTGWNAGLLSARLGAENVTSIEYDPTVHAQAREHLAAAGFAPTLVCGDGADGHLPGAPYDRILVTCSITVVPPAWIEQTAPGGLIVAPWATEYGGEAVVRLTVGEDGTASGRFTRSAAFMQLRQQRRQAVHVREYMGGDWPADGDRSTTGLSPEEVGDWLPMFAIGLRVPGVFPWAEYYNDGTYTLWLRDTAVTSWATVDYEPDRTDFAVVQGGRRRLWDEVEAAYRWWREEGSPGFAEFGLTVDRDGWQHGWLRTPGQPVTANDAEPGWHEGRPVRGFLVPEHGR